MLVFGFLNAGIEAFVFTYVGKTVETGNHKQLLRKKGLYFGLWAKQTGGFLVDAK